MCNPLFMQRDLQQSLFALEEICSRKKTSSAHLGSGGFAGGVGVEPGEDGMEDVDLTRHVQVVTLQNRQQSL